MPARRRWPTHRPRTKPPGPWKHGPTAVIGLIGGIGSGKSAVAAYMATLGGFVIDADKVGHALLTQRPIRELLVERFGTEILAPSATDDASEAEIDRRALGAIVFADRSARKSLEDILHPRMRETFLKAIRRTIRRGEAKAIVLDAAVLYEAGWDSLCDRVLFVDAPRELRVERLKIQRGWDLEMLQAREKAQQSLEEKRDRADLVVANTNGLDELHAWIDRAWVPLLAATPPGIRPGHPSAPLKQAETQTQAAGRSPASK